jgi:hypothetical protein
MEAARVIIDVVALTGNGTGRPSPRRPESVLQVSRIPRFVGFSGVIEGESAAFLFAHDPS